MSTSSRSCMMNPQQMNLRVHSNWQTAVNGDQIQWRILALHVSSYVCQHCQDAVWGLPLQNNLLVHNKWQTALNDIQILWMILLGYRFPQTYVNIVNMQYEDFHCKIICGSTSNWQTTFNDVQTLWMILMGHRFLQKSRNRFCCTGNS